MTQLSADTLLREALLLFNDRPKFGLRRDPDVISYRLAARIEACLEAIDGNQVRHASGG